jgi:MoxR-like ATPase
MQPTLDRLRTAIGSVYLGNRAAVDQLLTCILARGHCLIEDVPGVGKSLLATALARCINASFARIQLTPDLLPADILGVGIYRKDKEAFVFQPGPIFANVVLADEINRATPRTQSAMLEVMNDATVTIDGITHPLPQPFILVATQNPQDFEGTFALPENQLDRFLLRLSLGYPTTEDEVRILDQRPSQAPLHALQPVVDRQQILDLQALTDRVRVEESLRRYIVALASATRTSDELALGLSPRGTLALTQAARAKAVIDGRDYVIPEDITANWLPVTAHRVIPRTALGASPITAAQRILDKIARTVPSPV